MYKRSEYYIIRDRILEPRKFIQVVMGPRQVGKSTVVKQVLNDLEIPYLFFSADAVPAGSGQWISECWEAARMQMISRGSFETLLVIDEIQKISNWSEFVKKEWDHDSFKDINLKVILLGSSRILLEKGLSESLAGRFEEIRMTHWTFPEMKEAFGIDLNEYIYFGGYPGAAHLIHYEERFDHYVESSIIEATLNKDILMDTPVSKPALMRRALELGSYYSGQILSLTKLIGELQDAGNTTTISSYIRLLSDSGLLGTINKFSIDLARRKASIPKFQVYNNALKTIYLPTTFHSCLEKPSLWGNVFESGIGAFLMSQAFVHRYELFYWREKNLEVDFVMRKNHEVVAIEVKSNTESSSKGLDTFKRLYKPKHAFIVGKNDFPPEEFLSLDLRKLFS